MSTSTFRRRTMLVTAMVTSVALGLTACSDDTDDGPVETEVTQEEIDAALEEGADLTFWAWGPQYEAVVDAFNEAYPNVNVTLQSQGSGTDHYTAFQNAVSAGSGVPDVVQIELNATPQFALSGSIIDLNAYGLGEMSGDFEASAWEASHYADGLWGLPQDAGPLAMFYRQDIFDKFGLEVPTTWDEYIAVGQALREADSDVYLAANAGEAGLTNALIWQAGGRPYSVEDSTVSIDFTDEGTQAYVEMESTLIEEGLVDTNTPSWTPEWNAGLANGSFATWIAGAWAAGTLQNRIPEAAGNWRVAPVPSYSADAPSSAQQGGSLSAVTEASENKLAAVGFVQWMASSEEATQIWVDLGGFPTATVQTESSDWLEQEVEYFGGQQINQVFADSAAAVGQGWEYLPFNTYAASVFGDSAGQAYVGEATLSDGLADWRETLLAYAESQGFEVAE